MRSAALASFLAWTTAHVADEIQVLLGVAASCAKCLTAASATICCSTAWCRLTGQFQPGKVFFMRSSSKAAIHSGRDALTADRWWDEFETIVAKTTAYAWTFIMIDANALLGEIVTSAVGDYQATKENFPGRRLRQLAQRYELTIPATHSYAIPEGASTTTWIGPQNKPRRIDYILVPANKPYLAMQAYAMDDIDISLNYIDHVPLRTTFKILQANGCRWAHQFLQSADGGLPGLVGGRLRPCLAVLRVKGALNEGRPSRGPIVLIEQLGPLVRSDRPATKHSCQLRIGPKIPRHLQMAGGELPTRA